MSLQRFCLDLTNKIFLQKWKFCLMFTLSGFISEASKLGTEGMPLCRLFSFEELTEATNNFDKSTILGEGTYGKVTAKRALYCFTDMFL